MSTLVCLFLFLMLMGGISLFGYRRYARPARMYEQLGAPVITVPAFAPESQKRQPPLAVRLAGRIGSLLPMPSGEDTAIKRTLMMAGCRSEHAVEVLFGIRVILALIFLGLVIVLRDMVTANPGLRIMLLFAGPAAGYCAPGFVLEKRVQRRQEALRLSLPDALDLMVISVEAGLGLDQAILHVSRELHLSHPEVSEELSLVTLEMRAGKRRSEALRNLAERTGEPELGKLVAILIQNDRFGTSMAESLRTHSDFMRTRRRQLAEERAAKVGVKLVFPIFFFILPSMMVVTAGPALLQIFKNLFPMMRQVH